MAGLQKQAIYCLYTISAPDIRRFPFDVCLFLFVDFDILRKLIFISKIVAANP